MTLQTAAKNRPTNMAVMPPQMPRTSHAGARLPTMRMNPAATALEHTVVAPSQRNYFIVFIFCHRWFHIVVVYRPEPGPES